MAVDPELVDAMAAAVADVYREAETALVELIARHLRAGLDSPTAERRLADVRALRRAAQAIVAALEADAGRAVREQLAAAYRHGWSAAVADIPERWFPRSGIGQAARAALAEIPGFAFVEALANALLADLGNVTRNILRDVDDAYRSVQAAAAARVLTGTQTRRDAAQAAWSALVARGITGFTDRAGRRWRLSSYVEMAARTNAQRAAIQGQVDRLDTLGVRLVYVSDAPQECRLCRPWEGKILRTDPGPLEVETMHATRDIPVTVTAAATLDQARALGFQHPNCRHSVSAYLPGVTRVPQRTADPSGDTARQRQRELERRIRRAKEREAAALTDEARRAARRRVRAAQAALREHLAAHPELKRLRYREQIGAGNIPPGRRGDAAGGLGRPVQPPLDGGPGAPAGTRRPLPDDQPAAPVEDTAPAPGQTAIDDDPLAGVDLEALTDEQLADLINRHIEDPSVVDRITREFERREAEEAAAAIARRPNPRDMSDDELVDALGDAMRATLPDQGWIDALAAEIDRREQSARDQGDDGFGVDDEEIDERAERVAQLIDEGWPEDEAIAEAYDIPLERVRRQRAIDLLREQGYTGRGLDELARAAYRDHVYWQWRAAEDATNGYLVNNEGRRRGIDPVSLFTGPEARARRWASDELLAWWDEHGRLTYDEFRAMLIADTSTLARRRESRRDFLS